MSPFKKFWPREMFKFRNPLDYSITEEEPQNRQINNKLEKTNPYNNLSSIPNQRISASFLDKKTYNPEFERDYQKTKYYNPIQQRGQANPYVQSFASMKYNTGNKEHQDRSPYNHAELFQKFEPLNPSNSQHHHNEYQDPRYSLNGQQLQGLNEYGLLQGQSKDKIVSEDEGWDLNDLPRPINHYRDVLPTMQFRPEHEPKKSLGSDEIQF